MTDAATVYDQIAKVCPVLGVRIGAESDTGTWVINFDPSATAQQRTNAAAIISGYKAAATAEAKRQAAIKSDAQRATLLAKLQSATPAQIDAYVAANVTTLAQARDMLGTILKLIALDSRG